MTRNRKCEILKPSSSRSCPQERTVTSWCRLSCSSLVLHSVFVALLRLLLYTINANFLYPFQIKSPLAFQWTDSLHFSARLLLWNITRNVWIHMCDSCSGSFSRGFILFIILIINFWSVTVALMDCSAASLIHWLLLCSSLDRPSVPWHLKVNYLYWPDNKPVYKSSNSPKSNQKEGATLWFNERILAQSW